VYPRKTGAISVPQKMCLCRNCLTVQHHLVGRKIRDTTAQFPLGETRFMATTNKSSRPAKKPGPAATARNSAGCAAAFSALPKIPEPYEQSFQRLPGKRRPGKSCCSFTATKTRDL
jgi:hypothetical protein